MFSDSTTSIAAVFQIVVLSLCPRFEQCFARFLELLQVSLLVIALSLMVNQKDVIKNSKQPFIVINKNMLVLPGQTPSMN